MPSMQKEIETNLKTQIVIPFPSVYSFTDPVDFLLSWRKEALRKNSRFSLRSWALLVGQTNAAHLSMILSRKRKLTGPLTLKLVKSMIRIGYWTEAEGHYFQVLVRYQNASSVDEQKLFADLLSSLRPDRNFSTLKLDALRLVSEPIHFILLEMTQLKDFKMDPGAIAQHLGSALTPSQVESHLERLLRLGLLKKNRSGDLVKTYGDYATPTDVANDHLKKFHTYMLDRAKESLFADEIKSRDITGYLMAIQSKKIPLAKKAIEEFRYKMADLMESEQGDAVYFLGVQFFNLLNKGESK